MRVEVHLDGQVFTAPKRDLQALIAALLSRAKMPSTVEGGTAAGCVNADEAEQVAGKLIEQNEEHAKVIARVLERVLADFDEEECALLLQA